MLDFDQATGIEVKHKSGCSQAAVEHKYDTKLGILKMRETSSIYRQFQLYNRCRLY